MKKSVKSSKKKSGPLTRRTINVLLFFVCAVLVGIFAFSGYKLYTILHGYSSAAKTYNNLTDSYVSSKPTATPFAAPEATEAPEAAATPEPVEASPIDVDFSQLLTEAPEVVGWIYSANTKINYPIAHHPGDNPITADYYYLYRDIHGEYSGNGTPFLDVMCAGDFSSYNNIVYGHHMNDGSMFASLDGYRKTAGYYEEHPVMYLNTPSRNYRVDIFAGYLTDADSSTYTVAFPDEGSFLSYCREMKAQSDFASDVEIEAGDRIITLSTCAYDWYDARYVVQGKLVPLGPDATTTVVAAG